MRLLATAPFNLCGKHAVPAVLIRTAGISYDFGQRFLKASW